MIKRIIEVFSTTTDELIEEFYIHESWTLSHLHLIVKADDDDVDFYLGYKLSRAQVILLGGAYLLELNHGDVVCFLSYNGSP